MSSLTDGVAAAVATERDESRPGSASPATAPDGRRGLSAADRLWWVLVAVVTAVGLAGVIRVWASDRGLWGDEVYIADNIQGLGFRGLTGALRHYQVAPAG